MKEDPLRAKLNIANISKPEIANFTNWFKKIKSTPIKSTIKTISCLIGIVLSDNEVKAYNQPIVNHQESVNCELNVHYLAQNFNSNINNTLSDKHDKEDKEDNFDNTIRNYYINWENTKTSPLELKNQETSENINHEGNYNKHLAELKSYQVHNNKHFLDWSKYLQPLVNWYQKFNHQPLLQIKQDIQDRLANLKLYHHLEEIELNEETKQLITEAVTNGEIKQVKSSRLGLEISLPENLEEINNNLQKIITFAYKKIPPLEKMDKYYYWLNQSKTFNQLCHDFQNDFQVPLKPVLTAIASTESDLNPKAYNYKTGATGLGQITPIAVIDNGYKFVGQGQFKADLQNPVTNLRYIAKKLNQDFTLLTKYTPDQSVSYFEAGYNTGIWHIIAVKHIYQAMKDNQDTVSLKYGSKKRGRDFYNLLALKSYLIKNNYDLSNLNPQLFFTILSTINPRDYKQTIYHYLRFNSVYFAELLKTVNTLDDLNNATLKDLQDFYSFAEKYCSKIVVDSEDRFIDSSLLKAPINVKSRRKYT